MKRIKTISNDLFSRAVQESCQSKNDILISIINEKEVIEKPNQNSGKITPTAQLKKYPLLTKDKGGFMKKFVTMIIIFACLLLAMSLWKPWSYFQDTKVSLSLSNESFLSGSPSKLSKFRSNTEIFYKLTKSKPFRSSVLTIQIYKIDKNQKESLHKERQEIGIDPKTKTFSFVLRPDYFRDSGKYRVKMYIGSAKDNKLAAKYDITIE